MGCGAEASLRLGKDFSKVLSVCGPGHLGPMELEAKGTRSLGLEGQEGREEGSGAEGLARKLRGRLCHKVPAAGSPGLCCVC